MQPAEFRGREAGWTGFSPRRLPLAELGGRQAAPTPVLQLDLLDHDESGVEWLVQHLEQELADACDELRLLIGCNGRTAGTGAFPRDLDRDDRQMISFGERFR
jgi:hypothetical protein